jgi:hypothetical protein
MNEFSNEWPLPSLEVLSGNFEFPSFGDPTFQKHANVSSRDWCLLRRDGVV